MTSLEDVFGSTTTLMIKQKFEALEALANAASQAIGMDALGALGETANRYDVLTDDGGLKFRVVEESELCGFTGRCCCRPNHKLQLHVFHGGEEVLYMDRGCKCGQCCACTDLCRQEMRVYKGPGEQGLLAHIKAPFMGGGLSPTLQVMDRDEAPVATIRANAVCCIGGMCCDHTFQIVDANGTNIGKIVKERPDSIAQVAAEMVGDSDNFTIHVPAGMPPEQKAAILAAMHLIDYWLFEDEGAIDANAVEGSIACKLCDLYCCGCVSPCSCQLGGGNGDDDNDGDGDGDGGDYGGDDGGD